MLGGVRQDAQFPVRRSVRLKGFDYSQPSAYFLTICACDQRCIFGEVIGYDVALSRYGEVANACWQSIPSHFPNVELAGHVVMPNHMHGLIIVRRRASAQGTRGAPGEGGGLVSHRSGALGTGSIPAIVRSFKSATTRLIREAAADSGIVVWQRGYYEHILADDDEFQRTCEYIRLNPANWASDEENAARMVNARAG